MDTKDFEAALKMALEDAGRIETDEGDQAIRRVLTFEEGGYFGYNQGLEVTLANGDQFTLTIHKK